MPFMPFGILGIWLRGLLSIALIGLGAYLVREWYEESRAPRVAVAVDEPDGRRDPGPPRAVEVRRTFVWHPGFNRPTAYLAGGLVLLAWSVAGGPVVMPLLRRRGNDEPRSERTGTVHRLKRPDGSELQVEVYGPPDAPPMVLTHGWGANSTAWYYLKRQLAGRFRLIVWDLPGLGLSRRPENNDYSLENLARDLDAVLALAGDRPAVLLGHSIGGMITLTHCRLFPEAPGTRVAGLVLVHTTYTNPVRTTRWAGLYSALEKPVLVPLLYLTIALWPLVWLMNWLAYLNGSAHRSTARQSFGGTETRGQLDFAARFTPHGSPAVLARGMFGMLAYDATATLPTIPVPALIVTGDSDPVTTPEAGEFMRGAIPDARLVALAPGKHFSLLEHHGQFADAVGEFAAACTRTRPEVPAGPPTT